MSLLDKKNLNEKEKRKKHGKKNGKRAKEKVKKVEFKPKQTKKENSEEPLHDMLEFTITGLPEEPEKKKTKGKKPEKEPESFKEKIAKLGKNIKNHKKWLVIAGIILILSFLVASLYFTYEPFQNIMDEYIFRKNKQSEDLVSIPLDAGKNPKVIAYDNSISVLAENKLSVYNSVGNLTGEANIKVNDPIYCANGKYLAIGEKSSSQLYLLERSNVIWDNDIEGDIARITVNKNGYTAIVITGTSYKSIVAVFDDKGKELFKIYLATTSVADIALSDDNKYLGIAEIDTTGTQIQSLIKLVELSKAQNNPKDSIVYTHKANAGDLLIDISFQSRGRLICLYDTSIHITTVNGDEELLKLEDDQGKANFAEVGLNNSVYRVLEKSSGLFKANTILEIVNTNSKKKNIHTVAGIAKSTSAYGNMIILNMGTEVEFLNDSGWIVKRYSGSRAIKDIVINGSIAGIVYRDQVEIINL